MILKDGTIIDRSTAAHKFGGDPMAEYLHCLSMDGGQDEDSGDVESPTGWFARFGRRILFTDSFGFVSVARLVTEAGAQAFYAELEAEYDAWAGDES